LLDRRGRLARGLFVISGSRSRLARGTGADLLRQEGLEVACQFVEVDD
jgi:hypothetical protein